MTVSTAPAALYAGVLRHRRFTPVRHEFRHPVFLVLLDVDRIADAMRVSRLTSYNRWNWASFRESDYFGDPSRPLRVRLEQDAARAGVALPGGRLLLLTHLRYLGYCFNPVSFVYCYDGQDRLVRILAGVSNTFGGSHNYWLEPASVPDGRAGGQSPFRSTSKKALYVSPFLGADLSYEFAFSQPGAQLTTHIGVRPAQGGATVFDATLTLERHAWDARTIRRTLCRYPWMTASVTARIHWEALRLWWKGVAVVPRPTPRGEFDDAGTARADELSRT